MSKNQNNIECPSCGETIDVNDILYHQVEKQIQQEYSTKSALQKEQFESQTQALNLEKKRLEADRKNQLDEIEKKVSGELKQREAVIKAELKAAAEAEQSDAIKSLTDELNEKSGKIKELNKTSIEFERLKREKDELEETFKAQAEKDLSARLLQERTKIQSAEQQKSEMKFRELEKQLNDQKKLTEEMKRKQEQGSMQTQGEVQELGIEEWLAAKFPLDSIQEIKKGERGADCLQQVNTRNRSNCGTIYYESKRAKSFQPSWIEKFKADIREKGADIGVLVTEVMPADMDQLGLKEGVWICSYSEFKSLCLVLRESIVKISLAISTQENKGDKMGMIYDYLTSNAFKLQIEAIVEGFTQMKSDLESEQRSMRSIWKKREKQIEKVLHNTTDMYGSIKGIAGNAIESVKLLELPEGDD